MSPSTIQHPYTPGQFGRELREMAVSEKELRTKLGDITQNGGSIDEFRESLANLNSDFEDWRVRFEQATSQLRDELIGTTGSFDLVLSLAAKYGADMNAFFSALFDSETDIFIASLLGMTQSNPTKELNWNSFIKNLYKDIDWSATI